MIIQDVLKKCERINYRLLSNINSSAITVTGWFIQKKTRESQVLLLRQLVVQSIQPQEALMVADLDDLTVLHDDDNVGILNRR